MYGKFIIFTVVLAFMALQLVQAKDSTHSSTHSTKQNVTQCYSCDSPSSCRSPQKLTCDQKMANATILQLAKHFSNVVNVASTQFVCLKTSYSHNNISIIDIRGCLNVGVNACGLRPLNTTLKTNKCKTCLTNLCNPAGTFSSSSAAIILSSVLSLVLLKYAHF
ncbi:uncharacterized protein LOC135951437 [Calliphora vicina]|uniref:uncharacterized protein LOC135951437 n=1 Tax=Calliphora vicina TaxID=7373 RepID=UPI00325A7814